MCLAASTPRISSGNLTPGSFESGSSPGARQPELPRRSVDTDEAFQPRRTIRVPAHGDLQAALDGASPGDVIALEEGATYQGPFRLPRKEGAGWIVITGTSSDARLPRPGQRVNPSHASAMPKLVASSGSVIVTEPAAHHYRFVGIEFSPARGTFLRDLIQLGQSDDGRRRGSPPHHLRSVLSARRPAEGNAPRHRHEFSGHGCHRLLPVGLQRGGRRLAGHCGMERPRAIQDLEQLPRSRRGKRVVRRRRSDRFPISCRPTSRFAAII